MATGKKKRMENTAFRIDEELLSQIRDYATRVRQSTGADLSLSEAARALLRLGLEADARRRSVETESTKRAEADRKQREEDDRRARKIFAANNESRRK